MFNEWPNTSQPDTYLVQRFFLTTNSSDSVVRNTSHRGPIVFETFEDVSRLLLCVLIMVINLVVVVFFLVNSTLRKFSEMFLVNLYVANTLSGAVWILELLTTLRVGHEAPLHRPMAPVLPMREKQSGSYGACIAQLCLSHVIEHVSPFALLTLSLDRYWRMDNVARYRKRQSTRLFLTMLTAPWLVSALMFTGPEMILRLDQTVGNYYGLTGSCSSMFVGRKAVLMYEGGTILAVVVILLVFNGYIYWLFRRRFVDRFHARKLVERFPVLNKVRSLCPCCLCLPKAPPRRRSSLRTMEINAMWDALPWEKEGNAHGDSPFIDTLYPESMLFSDLDAMTESSLELSGDTISGASVVMTTQPMHAMEGTSVDKNLVTMGR